MVRLTASRRLTWPSRLFVQVGEFESSKSAMNTSAPELSALMIILRSTGPVISTRRSIKSAGMEATDHSALRMFSVSGRKSGSSPASIRACRSRRAARQLLPRPSNVEESFLRKATASVRQHGFVGVGNRRSDLNLNHWACHLNLTSREMENTEGTRQPCYQKQAQMKKWESHVL